MVSFYTPAKKAVSRQTIRLIVHDVDGFGQGVARHQGKTIFIKNALPNEEVEVRLTEDKKQYAKAVVVRYLTTSPERLTAKCIHYNECGGCEMQHIPSAMQHQIKLNAFLDLCHKEFGELFPISKVELVTADEYHYRRRARLSILFDKQQLTIGFRKSDSNQLIDISQCPVLTKPLELLLKPLKNCLARLQNKKALGHAELIDVDSGQILILRHMQPFPSQDIVALEKFANEHNISLYLHGKFLMHLAGHKSHFYQIGDLKLTFSPLDFIQVNGNINLKMVEQALDWLSLERGDQVLDLFCGMGNFSLPMAKYCSNVSGVEVIDALVDKARVNFTLNEQKLTANGCFFVSNLDEIDKRPAWYSPQINKVLLDPARAGAAQTVKFLVKQLPKKIVYISCNPATLVRDCKVLLDAGYQIEKTAVLDMFPQTKHIESMMLFSQSGTK